MLSEERAIAPSPDLIILLDLPVKTALARIEARGPQRSVMENRKFLESVRERYKYLVRTVPEPVVLIDASLDEEAVHRHVLDLIGLN